MQLEDFVAESLVQIVRGVEKAQKATAGTGANINPEIKRLIADNHRVDFDVAVTAIEDIGTKGAIGVLPWPVKLNAQGESNSSNTTANRIKFSIVVVLPQGPRFGANPPGADSD